MSLEVAFKKLVLFFRRPQILKRRMPPHRVAGPAEPVGEMFSESRLAYEPTNIWHTLELRLGAESGPLGWWRLWRMYREAAEISADSIRLFRAIH